MHACTHAYILTKPSSHTIPIPAPTERRVPAGGADERGKGRIHADGHGRDYGAAARAGDGPPRAAPDDRRHDGHARLHGGAGRLPGAAVRARAGEHGHVPRPVRAGGPRGLRHQGARGAGRGRHARAGRPRGQLRRRRLPHGGACVWMWFGVLVGLRSSVYTHTATTTTTHTQKHTPHTTTHTHKHR